MMESIPDNWRIYMNLLEYGLQWICSRFSAYFIKIYALSRSTLLLWSSIAILVLSGLFDLIRLPTKIDTTDHEQQYWKQLFSNRYSRRQLIILIHLWFWHGYTSYILAAHEEEGAAGNNYARLAFLRFAKGVAKGNYFVPG